MKNARLSHETGAAIAPARAVGRASAKGSRSSWRSPARYEKKRRCHRKCMPVELRTGTWTHLSCLLHSTEQLLRTDSDPSILSYEVVKGTQAMGFTDLSAIQLNAVRSG